jgi:hypothetical protein
MDVQTALAKIKTEIALVNTLNEKSDIHASELDILCDQLNEAGRLVDDLLVVRSTKVLHLNTLTSSLFQFTMKLNELYTKCAYTGSAMSQCLPTRGSEPHSAEIKSYSRQIDEYIERLRQEVDQITKPNPFESKAFSVNEQELISPSSYKAVVNGIPALVRRVLTWDPDEAVLLSDIGKEDTRFLKFIGYTSISPRYLLAFEQPRCSLRSAMAATPEGLSLHVILTILYNIADLFRVLHNRGYKLNHIALDNVYLAEDMMVAERTCAVAVRYIDYMLVPSADSRSGWDGSSVKDRLRWLPPVRRAQLFFLHHNC